MLHPCSATRVKVASIIEKAKVATKVRVMAAPRTGWRRARRAMRGSIVRAGRWVPTGRVSGSLAQAQIRLMAARPAAAQMGTT